MIDFSVLPPINATLNGIAGICMICGLIAIRSGNMKVHRGFMLTAASCSLLFLISYVTYHSYAGITKFTTEGWPRALYFGILFTHTPLAACTLPLVFVTLSRALRGNIEKHKRLARWTFPIWLYVSVTGVLIYFMLYQWFPPVQNAST